jgi:glycosyltransferase involved in cell wall biosynthesis
MPEENMKVLVANKMDWEHPRSGGAEVNLRETLTRLVQRGHEVHLVTSMYPGAEPDETVEGVHIHRYGLDSRTNEIFILTIGQILFNYWIRNLEPDVIYTVSSLMTWIPVTRRRNHLVSIHHLNDKSNFGQFKFPLNILSYVAEKISILLTLNKQVMTVSPATSEDLTEHGVEEENITEILNGINYRDYDTGENSEFPTVLYLGRLEYNKGADLIPEIYRNIEELDDNIKLEIAGRGRKEEKIEEFAEDREKVDFHGYVSEDEKHRLLQEAWIVITPSRKEGWGLTVAEANASGTPVVGFNNGGLKYSIKDGKTGVLVNSNPEPKSHLEEFAEAVVDLIENNSKREELEENTRKFAEKRSWDDTVDELEELLKTVSREQ